MKNKYLNILLIITMVFMMTSPAYGETEVKKIEDFNQIDTKQEIEKKIDAEQEIQLLEEEWQREDENKVDRFIVKYKGAIDKNEIQDIGNRVIEKENLKRAERTEKLHGFLEKSLDDQEEIELQVNQKLRGIKSKNTQDQNLLPNKLTVFSEPKINTTISETNLLESEVVIIELSEYVDPDAFISEFSAETDMDTIEYIQPDYLLELADTKIVTMELDGSADQENIQADEPMELESSIQELPEEPESVTEEQADDVSEITADTETIEKTIEKINQDDIIYNMENDIASAHQISKGNGVTVAIIDTGIDTTHPDLEEKFVSGYDFINDTDVVYNPDLGMEQAHGTHIAGIIVKTAPESKIMPLKVFENGTAYTSDIIEAIEFAKNNGAQVINMSFGSKDNNQALKEAMIKSDLFYVCAAGNNRIDVSKIPIYPASFNLPNSISVTALNQDLGFSYFSNYSPESVDIAAFGRDVESTLPNGEYGVMNGTSMSAGYVSGAAALVLEKGERNVKDRLKGTSDKLSNLQNKVAHGNQLNLTNVVNNTINSDIININPADDFNVHGYQPTPEENWELFAASNNVQVEAGTNHTVVLKENGTIWAWGRNTSGALGDGTNVDKSTPVQVIGISNVKEIAAGQQATAAVTEDGKVYTWGAGGLGQLGHGNTTSKNIPTKLAALSNIQSIKSGIYHFAALTGDGRVYTWGYGDAGQLGNNPYITKTSPVLTNVRGAKKIFAGDRHTMAITGDGELYICGQNAYYQLGELDTGTAVVSPHRKMEWPYETADIAISNHTLLATTDGKLYTWGDAAYGKTGNGNKTLTTTPSQKLEGVYIKKVASSLYLSVVLTEEGDVYTCGLNTKGELGLGYIGSGVVPFTRIPTLSNIIAISAGPYHVVALSRDGKVYTWGRNTYGEIGDGSTNDRTRPYAVDGEVNAAKGTSFTNPYEFNPAIISEIDNTFEPEYNNHYYKFTASKSGKYIMKSVSTTDTFGYLLDSEGTMITYNDDGGTGKNSNNYYDFYIEHPLVKGETYYVQIGFEVIVAEEYKFIIIPPQDMNVVNYAVTGNAGDNIVLMTTAKNILMNNDSIFKVEFDASQIEIADLIYQTFEKETSTGVYRRIEVVDVSAGSVSFKILNVNSTLRWSGILNIFKFKLKFNGTANIKFSKQ